MQSKNGTIMKRIITSAFTLILAATLLSAQNDGGAKAHRDNTPEAGSWSVGVKFNMLGLGQAVSQPGDGEGVATFISSTSAMSERQMSVMAENPLVQLQFKHKSSKHWAQVIGVGISGSHLDYREYVFDDLARKSNPDSD